MNLNHEDIELLVDFCSFQAAKYACLNWHYSKSVPAGKIVKIGVWENKEYIGCVLFSRGANRKIGMPYQLDQTQICELTRIALNQHKTPVTKILSKAIKLLKKNSPKLKLIVSYADTNQKHLGIIYQASNWIYTGKTAHEAGVILNGKKTHRRSINSKYGTSDIQYLKKHIDPNVKIIKGEGKHKYLYPLNKMLRKKLMKLHKPYPKNL